MRDISGLLLDIWKLESKSKTFAGIFPPEVFDPAECGFRVLAPIEIEITAQAREAQLKVTGTATGEMYLECSKCLVEFPFPLELELDRVYTAGQDPADKVPEWEMENDIVYLNDATFSLRRMVTEEMILAVPMVAWCRGDCRGLCQQCGANLNSSKCDCVQELRRNPFAVLSGFKSTTGNKK